MSSTSPETSAPALENGSLLIVEDGELTRELVKQIALNAGIARIDTASTGAEALEMMSRHHYWLVLSDLRMSPMSGLDLLRAVKADARLKPRKFLVMTSRGNADGAKEAERAGADAIMLKPFSLRDFEATLRKLLAAG